MLRISKLMALQQIPDTIRFINLYGIPYYIPWEDFLPGYSVFLKTTACAREVRDACSVAEKHFQITLRAHPRLEFGYYGVRVWRLS